jgi:hypothetical protein
MIIQINLNAQLLRLVGQLRHKLGIRQPRHVRFVTILLKKSKVATPRIFREDKRWETIADSYTLNRVAEIAGEFDARGHVPPHLYTEDAPTARRIFDHLCKTTFATVSGRKRTLGPRVKTVVNDRCCRKSIAVFVGDGLGLRC